eukprot:5654505-Pyramimonas_sp.AAC.1
MGRRASRSWSGDFNLEPSEVQGLGILEKGRGELISTGGPACFAAKQSCCYNCFLVSSGLARGSRSVDPCPDSDSSLQFAVDPQCHPRLARLRASGFRKPASPPLPWIRLPGRPVGQ